METRIRHLPFVLALSCAILGHSWIGPSADPDVDFGWDKLSGTFLVFVSFLTCVLGWGDVLLRKLKVQGLGGFGRLWAGTCFAALTIMVLGHAGAVGYSLFWGLWAFLLVGPALQRFEGFRKPNFKSPSTYLALAVAFVIATRVLKGFLVHGTSDPVMYHLLGPRLWADRGGIYFPEKVPIVFQATYWEYLYLWGQSLLGAEGGRGLIEGQLFSQWLHAVAGMGGATLALRHLLKRGFGVQDDWAWACALIALGSKDLLPIATLAKNDWGSIFWFLGAAAIVLDPTLAVRQRYAIAGVGMGIAVATKTNLFFSVIPFLFGLAVKDFGKPGAAKHWGVAAIGFILGWMPIAVRNWVFVGNPFYPFATGIFGYEWFGPSWRNYSWLHPTIYRGDFPYLASKAMELLRDNPLNLTLILVPLLAAISKTPRKWLPLGLGCLAAIGWYLVMDIHNSFVRWAGPPLLLFPVLGILAACELLGRRLAWLALLPAVGYVVSFSSAGFSLSGVLGAPSPALAIRMPGLHMGGDSKAWLRMNAGPGEAVATTGDNQLYYIGHLDVSAIPDDPVLDRKMAEAREPASFVAALRGHGIKYVLDTRHFAQLYWSRVAMTMNRVLEGVPEAVVYEGADSKVIDLERLDAALSRSCRSGGAGFDFGKEKTPGPEGSQG